MMVSSTRRSAPGRRLARVRLAAAVSVAALVVPALTAARLPGGGAGAQPNQLRPVAAKKPVPVHAVAPRPVKTPAMPSWRRPRVSWPAPGAGTVTVGGVRAGAPVPAARVAAVAPFPSAGSSRAGTLPVWVGPALAAAPAGAAAPGQVRVRMLPRSLAKAAGISGVVFTVSGAAPAAAGVHVSLDYKSFAFADGGAYASRLRLVELPACVLATPQVASCRRQTPLASADNALRFRLGADVTLPEASPPPNGGPAAGTATSSLVVLAATTSPSGSGGDYSATPLTEAGTWQAGGSSGAFTYSYPIQAPPVPGGLAPMVSLSYNSQAVDGLTSSTNNQASWVGDGWDYQPGYIERDYESCEQTSKKTGDLCWSSDNTTTLSLNGADSIMVDDSSTGWHAQSDNGYKIQYLTGTSNGTHDGDYWVVTDPGGTTYYFGLSHLPGYASGDQATNSAWTAPVYSPSSGQPCYNSTFSKSHCMQAWRWNLDYVVDRHGNAMAFYYNTETNYYAADNGTTATASYTQGGALSKIEYGLRSGAVYGVTPAAQVNFTTVTTRTDVPTDLSCSSGASCSVISPTFWIKYQLSKISTQTLKGSALASVDSWALSQTFPATGDGTADPPMWLASVTRTGQDGTAVSLPPVKFAGKSLANRVETATDTQDGYSIIDRFRLWQVTNETGGVITVTYDSPPTSCTSGNFPQPDANSSVCYPDYWTPPGASSPVEDWFNKYVVTQVGQTDTTGGSVTPVVTTYCYGTAPGCLTSGAWHYNDSPLVKSSQRTWDQWRGFQTVTTETGTSPDPVTETTDTYFQGMDGDYQSNGTTTSASLTSTLSGDKVTDSDQFAGQDLQHVVYDGAGGAMVSGTVTIPWTSAATATQSQPSPLPALQAFMTGTQETKDYTALASGGNREGDTTYTYDSYGRVTSVSDVPDTADAGEDTCTTTSYGTNTSEWLLDLPTEVKMVSVPCGTTPSLPADAVSDQITLYDGATSVSSDTPTKGDVTQTELATSYSGSTPVYTTESKATYDEYGRALTSADADGRTTSTAYTPATGAEPTSVTVTDPMGLATITAYDPARDLPLTVTSPAGWVTAKTYDALGRLTAAWSPGHSTSGPADATFAYSISDTAPSVVTTSAITATGSHIPSETLYDSLGRPVETQTQTPDGGRDITDTYYNSDGWKSLTSDPYYTTGAPSATLVQAQDSQVPSQTAYVYDGAGRVVREISYKFANETWETDTAYGGDYTTVTPPAGSNPSTTYTNGLGETSYIYQYHGTPPATPPAPGSGSATGSSGWDQTAYTYTPAGQLHSITDAAGNSWSYSYDLVGDRVSQTTPDTGTTSSSYDAAGQMMSTTDSRGKQISYTYDLDGRKTAEYDTTGNAAESGSDELASWVYDTLAKGQPTSSTTYTGGTTGTSYTEQVTGYNSYGLATGSLVHISAGPLAGTYRRSFYYTSYADLQSSYYDYAAGGLPAEQVDSGYNSWGQPDSLGSSLWTYVAALSYDELGRPQEYAFGTTTSPAWLQNTYDQQTGRLTSAVTQTGSSPVTVGDLTYTYDNSGNVTSEADTPAAGSAQAQCFQYDYLGRLTQAWSQGSASCSSGPSQSAEAGAAAPYWNAYTYNTQNDLTSVTATPPSGSATTTTNTFNPPGSTQPHAIQSSAPAGQPATTYGYDAAGHTTSITSSSASQSLSWNDAGQLASVTSGGATTSYVYDAAGSLLLQTDPGSVTLYLPDEQITEDTSTGTITGVRYYTLGGVTVAARTSTGTVDYLAGDQQGTDTLAIDSGTLAVTRRYYDPYGNPIGTPPTSWPGNKGFVGGTADPATSLTNLGLREYNPTTGSFISTDPLLAPYNPQDLNPYAYSADSPATKSDPTGAMCNGDPGVAGCWVTPGGGKGPCAVNPSLCAVHDGTPQATTTTYPGPWAPGYNPPPNLLSAPPIHYITHSPRAITPHQASAGNGYMAAGGGLISRLPTGGSYPFEPGRGQRLSNPRTIRRINGNPVDRYGDEWRWDPIKGEWDVQHPDGSHTNVGPDGEITHGDNNMGRQPQAPPNNDGSNTKAVIVGGASAVGGGVVLWWIGKLASPLCGPALPACAIAF